MSQGVAIQGFIQPFNAQQAQPVPPELRDMQNWSQIITNRLQVLREPVRWSYIPPNVQGEITTLSNERDSVMSRWLPQHVRQEDLADGAKLRAHKGRISDALDQLIVIYNRWGQPPLRTIIGTAIVALGAVTRGCPAYLDMLAVPALLLTTAPNLQDFHDQRLAAWRRPRLRIWLEKAGLEAANGYLRIVNLGEFAGKPVHLSLYIANIDLDGDLSIDDAVDDVIATLVPDVDNQWRGTHVTLEVFGRDDQRNPKFFKPNSFRFNNANVSALTAINTTAPAVSNNLSQKLATKITDIRNKLTIFMAERAVGLI